ncbi:class I SAM-dependent DNA methyltransferase [Streptomyces avicenniae]|uniref:class I SAM-dependent DNA methyltransferase n=1 Tax=Streptomyces avicenniae TaxID=500153 RepID=UPI00069A46EB|nr:class I SAM-dependent methyltransferase [Streptomyces avicenniae]
MSSPDRLDATRASYDAVAPAYADRFRDELEHKPFDRALLATFAELVTAAGGGPVLDVGCGFGRITGYLASLGLDVSGTDLSPGMLAAARESFPALRFTEGSMTALDLPDGGLAGLTAWYSLIHLPPEDLPVAFAEFHRVLAPGGLVQIAFQVRPEPVHLDTAFGQPVDLDYPRLPLEHVEETLRAAGFVVLSRLLRAPDKAEHSPQAIVLAHRDPDV